MLYLSGAKNQAIADDLATGRMGLLNTPASRYSLDNVACWAMDNGCFTNTYPGDSAYLELLTKMEPHRSSCLFVAVPDIVGNGPATLAKFQPIASHIRAAGWPVALVAQDGMQPDQIPWAETDWLFIGGSTEWKLGAEAVSLIQTAKARGVRVHIGRVNSSKRFRTFAGLGADSADGTFIAFGPDKNAPKVRAWMTQPIQGLLLNGATA